MDGRYIKAFRRIVGAALLAWAAVTGAMSCGSIYDYEGDCAPHWRVKFIYDYNMRFADAFSGRMGVGSVHLYVYDAESGELVLEKEETAGPEGFGAEYVMPVEELAVGRRYDFVAWCGLSDNSSFEGAVSAPSRADYGAPAWWLTAEAKGTGGAEGRRLDPLYYGRTKGFELYDAEGEHVVPVHLMKDTDEFTILLQHRSGRLDPEDFEIRIEDANTSLRWDNGLTEGVGSFSYLPWWQKSGTVEDTPEITGTPGMGPEFLVVRLSTPRLVKRADRRDDPRLVITNVRDGSVVYDIDLLEYLLLPEEHTHLRDAHNNVYEVTDQEYLDRADDWTLQFILGDKVDGGWYAMDLHILGWHVIRMSADLGGLE